jgi:DNA-binding NarL/FixJ family response regulator
MKKTTILLVDDHPVVISGLKAIISEDPRYVIAGEATDGKRGIKKAVSLKPDIVIMDLAMPGLNGFLAMNEIRKDLPYTKIMVLSMHREKQYVVRALRSGAAAYLLKEGAGEELLDAVRKVGKGQSYISPSIASYLLEDYVFLAQGVSDPLEKLTPREQEVLILIAQGKTSAQIATFLYISAKTVKTHRANLMEKTEIHDTAGLVRFAIEKGLLPLDG